MADFTENVLVLKLQELNENQQNIQTLSLWLLHHKKHYVVVVRTWFTELMKTKDSKLLPFMYLADDVIQNSLREGPEYRHEFEKMLMESFKHINTTDIDAKRKHTLYRILSIWEEREIYDSQKIQEFKEAIDLNNFLTKNVSKRKSDDLDARNELGKKMKIEERGTCCMCGGPKTLEIDTTLRPYTPHEDLSEPEKPFQLEKILELLLPPASKPRDPEELIRALVEFDESNTSDEAIRQRIAESPPEEAKRVAFIAKMPPFYRINFIIQLIKKLYDFKKLERELQITSQKIDDLKRLQKYM